jgi:hypothetical protein
MKSLTRRIGMQSRRGQPVGSVIPAVMIFTAVFTIIVGTVLSRTMSTYRQISHVASWQESLLAAEAGSDTAMAELRKTLIDPVNAFSTWSGTDEAGNPLANQGKRLVCPTLVHKGEGNVDLDASVTIDAPPELNDGGERQWYRIRSTGTTYLPGVAHVTADKRDHLLRRLAFHRDPKANKDVTRPQSTRLVEVIAKPTSWENAITSDLPISLNNYKIVVDSYDSRFPEKSNNGLYDVTKALQNGDVATNSKLIDAGDAHIYGDAYTNAGSIVNGGTISGEQRTDFYQELLPIKKPTWSSYEPSPTVILKSATLTGGTSANPKRYKVSKISLEGDDALTIAPSAFGVESYTEIWLTGDMKTSGNGSIVIQPSANLKIFIEGSIDIKGNGTFNANSQPVRLQILGIEPDNGASRTMTFSGNGVIVAAVYAPDHDITFGATGSAGTFWGALTGRTITMGGTTYIHYDEALADRGHITDYKLYSWFEDNR